MHSAFMVIQTAPMIYSALKTELACPRNWMQEQPGRDIIYHIHESYYGMENQSMNFKFILLPPPYATGSWSIKKDRASPEVPKLGIFYSISLTALSAGFGRRDKQTGCLVLSTYMEAVVTRWAKLSSQKHTVEPECPQTYVNGLIFLKLVSFFLTTGFLQSTKQKTKHPNPPWLLFILSESRKRQVFFHCLGMLFLLLQRWKRRKSVLNRSRSPNYH